MVFNELLNDARARAAELAVNQESRDFIYDLVERYGTKIRGLLHYAEESGISTWRRAFIIGKDHTGHDKTETFFGVDDVYLQETDDGFDVKAFIGRNNRAHNSLIIVHISTEKQEIGKDYPLSSVSYIISSNRTAIDVVKNIKGNFTYDILTKKAAGKLKTAAMLDTVADKFHSFITTHSRSR